MHSVGAQQEHVSLAHVDLAPLEAGLGSYADGARQDVREHRGARPGRGGLRARAVAAEYLALHRVVVRELPHLARAEAVDAAVAHVSHDRAASVLRIADENGRGGAHLPVARLRGVRAHVRVRAPHRRVHKPHALGEVGAPRNRLRYLAADDLARDAASLAASHSVGDAEDESAPVYEDVVLVLAANGTALAEACDLDVYAAAASEKSEKHGYTPLTAFTIARTSASSARAMPVAA